MITFRAFAVWLGILVLAIANGGIREAALVPTPGLPSAHIISGIILAGLILLVAYFTLPWIGPRSVSSYLVIGIGWLFLTLLFEFTFGRIILGKLWPQLFEAYMFRDGNIWPIVLIGAVIAPYVAATIRGWA